MNKKSAAIKDELRFMVQVCWAGVVMEFAGIFFSVAPLFLIGLGVWVGSFIKQILLARQLYYAKKKENEEKEKDESTNS